MMIVEYYFPMVYKDKTEAKIVNLTKVLNEIFYLYDIERRASEIEAQQEKDKCDGPKSLFNMFDDAAYNMYVEIAEREKVTLKSQLDNYLAESIVKVGKDVNFDILEYWKMTVIKYKTLSIMARDILSIPISSVASECAFSIGERLISNHKATSNQK